MSASDPDPFELEHGPAAGKPPEEPLDEVLRPAQPLRAYLREKAALASGTEWTLAEGARDVLRFLARRAVGAAVLWVVLAAILAFFCGFGGTTSELSWFTAMMATVALLAGLPVGAMFSQGLVDAVRFCGWVPFTMALVASVAVIAAGSALVGAFFPWGSAFLAVVVSMMASLGAAAAVTRRTWAEV